MGAAVRKTEDRMPRFVITYDLRKPDQKEDDYKKLYDELDSLKAKHIQDSVWAVTSTSNADTIFKALRAHMDPARDRLLVVATTEDYKCTGGFTPFKDA